jgi:glucose/arabinose dehydrogenase
MKIRLSIVIVILLLLVSCSTNNETQSNLNENLTESTNDGFEDNNDFDESSEPTVIEDEEVQEEVNEEVIEKTEVEKLYEAGFNLATYDLVEVFDSIKFITPLYLTSLSSETEFVYIVQKNGQVVKVNTNDDTHDIFLDVGSRIDVSKNEKGLLGLAFHPNYPVDPRLFISYTNKTDSVIASLEVKEGIVDLNSHRILLSFEQPYSNHNGGHIAFGPDGYLYIASGDGGGSGDPQNNAQDLSNLMGKILRIDVDVKEDNKEYGIPEDNPFTQVGDAKNEIFAYGLRNPWKFSFDRVRNLMLAADVGQDAMEEVNIIESGGNYGWSIYEGTKTFKDLETSSDLVSPIWEYEHAIGKSITGGFTYYGEKIQSLYGVYIFGDFISGKVWGMWLDENQEVTVHKLLDTKLKIASFGRDEFGEIYLLDYTGQVYKMVEIK